MYRLRRYLGFTLIELLVVIAIIAILMGILVPVLSKVRKMAYGVACRSNMRQIGLAAAMYAEDNDGHIPRGAGWDLRNIWFQEFMPHLSIGEKFKEDYRDVEIYRCPAFPIKEQTVCYVNNSWGFRSEDDKIGYAFDASDGKFNLYDHKRLSETIYLTDNSYGEWRPIIVDINSPGLPQCDVYEPKHLPTMGGTVPSPARRVALDLHRKGCNALFADWHSEYVPANEMTADDWRFHKR